MDTKALRQKILDLAIHGKLVPQDPNDEPASVLLQRIREEKERLINEGKIKKGKKSAKTSDTGHYPYLLPKGWCLTNIGDLLINRDGERKPVSAAIRSKQIHKVYDYYGAAGVIDKVDDYLFDEKLLLIGEDGANLLSKSKDNAFFADGKYWVNNHAHVLDATNKDLLNYVAIVINSMNLDDYITGSAQPKLSQDNLNKIPIALPPLFEQKRIMSEIERWFSQIDIIESGKASLQVSVKQAKSKILDLAFHGKLVPQDPADEPASELLCRINPKAEIASDNAHYGKVPFDVPSSWEWTTLGEICTFLSRGKSPKYKDDDRRYPVFAQKCNLKDGGISLEQARFLDPATVEKWGEEYKLKTGDVLINSTGTGTVGRTRLFSEACLGRYPFVLPDSHVSVVRTHDEIDSDFTYYYISSGLTQHYLEDNLAGSTNQKELYIGVLDTMKFPLPPLAEQHRIVSKIEEFFAQLDRIEAEL